MPGMFLRLLALVAVLTLPLCAAPRTPQTPDEIARQILAPLLDPAKVATLKGDHSRQSNHCRAGQKHQRLDAALDKLRARYGRKVIYFGSVQESRDEAPMHIAFSHIPELGLEQV